MTSRPPWIEHRPEPAHLWLRWAPAAWPDAGALWVDLSRSGLGSLMPAAADLGSLEPPDTDDLVWLPPVADGLLEAREELAARVRGRGAATLVQLLPGQPQPIAANLTLVDLLSWLVERPVARPAIPVGAWILWPLLPGLSDDLRRFDEACAAWRAEGAAGVLFPSLRLLPIERRLLARGREEIFDALFHGGEIAEHPYVETAQAHGLGCWLPRPGEAASSLGRRRVVAGVLSEIGELWSRLDGSPHRSESFFRAARELEAVPWDLAALEREGNLGVLFADPRRAPPEVRQVVAEVVASGRSTLRDDLLRRYLGAPPERVGRLS